MTEQKNIPAGFATLRSGIGLFMSTDLMESLLRVCPMQGAERTEFFLTVLNGSLADLKPYQQNELYRWARQYRALPEGMHPYLDGPPMSRRNALKSLVVFPLAATGIAVGIRNMYRLHKENPDAVRLDYVTEALPAMMGAALAATAYSAQQVAGQCEKIFRRNVTKWMLDVHKEVVVLPGDAPAKEK